MPNSKQEDFFETPPAAGSSPGIERHEPAVVIEIEGRMPSWNDILGMEHWARDKFKSQLQDAFSSGLRQSAAACSMKTTSAKSIMLIAADTLDYYRETVRARRKLRRDKRKQSLKDASLFESKSSKSKVPF